MKRLLPILTLVFTCALAACETAKAPAEAALKVAHESFTTVSAEAEKYVPEQAKAVQEAIASADGLAAKNDWANALTQAQALPAKIGALAPAIAAKKAELTTAWTAVSAVLPAALEALKSKVDVLALAKKLPAGLTKESVDGAKMGVMQANQALAEATTAANGGDVAGALAKATKVKSQVVDMFKGLNLELPAGLAQ